MKRTWLGLGLATVTLIIGCGGLSPVAVNWFMGRVTGVIPGPSGPGTPPADGGADPNGVCSLAEDRRVVRIELRNESVFAVRFALVFTATAGTNGFVCPDALANYTAFGYAQQNVSFGGSINFGCQTISLTNGTVLLAAERSGQIAARAPNETFTSAAAPFDGNTDIPLPQFIILGERALASPFSCVNSDPCTQAGFIYNNGTPAISLRTQGTLCRERIFTQPLWALAPFTQADRNARAFEYVKAGTIVITVLDRSQNFNVDQNQVVWQVNDENDVEVHRENR